MLEEELFDAPDWISANLFREQLNYLRKKGYTSIDPLQLLKPESLPEKPVLITFDDGYEGVYTHAYPILKEFEFKATLFLISSVTGSGNNPYYNEWDKGKRPVAKHLSIEVIKEMLKSNLISLGSHSHSHNTFNKLSEKEIDAEISRSQEFLEETFDKRINIFSYPGGYTGNKESTYKILNKWGMKLAFAAQNDKVEDLRKMEKFNLHRINISSANTLDNPVAKLRFPLLIHPLLSRISRINKLSFLWKFMG